MNLQELTRDVIALTREVGQYVRSERERISEADIEVKGLGDYVSHADKEAERRLRAGLLELLPGSSFMGEEASPEERGGDWRWIVDPIDGTANYLCGLPVYAISVALEDRRKDPERFGPIMIGVVDEPGLGVTYDAFAGGGARKNGAPITVNEQRLMEHATIATAFPFRRRERIEDYFALFQSIYPRIADFRRVGSAAADLCWVAEGVFDGYFEMGLKPWDVAAGALMIQEAGGRISDWWGDPVVQTGWTVCGSPTIYRMLRDAIDEKGFPQPAVQYR